jgi:hypothetical protein
LVARALACPAAALTLKQYLLILGKLIRVFYWIKPLAQPTVRLLRDWREVFSGARGVRGSTGAVGSSRL